MKKNWKLKLKIINTRELTLSTESNKIKIQYSPFEHDIVEKLIDKQVRSNNVILFNFLEIRMKLIQKILNTFLLTWTRIFYILSFWKIKSTISD